MSSLLDLVTQSLGGDATQQISQQLGANPQQTQSAISAALPMLLAGLTRNAQSPGGAEALHDALASHDGNVLEQLSGLLNGSQNADGAGMLQGEHAAHAQASPDLMSMANQLFDRDGDGNAMNDVLKGLGGLLGGR